MVQENAIPFVPERCLFAPREAEGKGKTNGDRPTADYADCRGEKTNPGFLTLGILIVNANVKSPTLATEARMGHHL